MRLLSLDRPGQRASSPRRRGSGEACTARGPGGDGARLQQFAPLLEPNPRAIKRFVNARATQILEDVVVPRDQLALWTVVRVRWPALADYLRTAPKAIDPLLRGTEPPAGAPPELAQLFGAVDVLDVVQSERGDPLTAASVRVCCGVPPGGPMRRTSWDAPISTRGARSCVECGALWKRQRTTAARAA
jgi:hypothetical protein